MTSSKQLEHEQWQRMMNYLRNHHEELWRQWFDRLEPQPISRGLMLVECASPVQKNYLQKKCVAAFREAAQTITGNLVALRFTTGEGDEDCVDIELPRPKQPAPVEAPEVAADEDIGWDETIPVLNPDYSFSTYVPGPNNELAFAASQAVAEQPGVSYNPLFLHGGIGIGKTHLLHAICQRVLEKTPRAKIIYTSCEAFSRMFLSCVQSGKMDQFRHKFRHADMLVIDDIHFLSGHERSQEEFFHTFNELHQNRKQLVLSSDASPDEITDLEERLISRFNWGLVAKIGRPDYETRLAIVKAKAQIREIPLADSVAEIIARRIDSSPRDLEGALINLQGNARLRNRPIDSQLAREILGEPTTPTRTNQATMQMIIEKVCSWYQLQTSDLQSRRRHRSITEPRQLCMWLARRHTRLSLQEIGGLFGGRDHTTVMHSIRAVDKRCQDDANYASQVEQIETGIKHESF